MRNIEKIILHTSQSPFGCIMVMNGWHIERGFDEIGYHYGIMNGYPFSSKEFISCLDGMIECGRPLDKVGAHAQGDNSHSIGICLIGMGSKEYLNSDQGAYTPKQYQSLFILLKYLFDRFNLTYKNVIFHSETKHGKEIGKTCPNIPDADSFRKVIEFEVNKLK